MTDEDANLPERSGSRDVAPSSTGKLLDAALSNLPPERRNELMGRALDEKLKLEVEAARANHRHSTSSADMANTVDHVRKLESATRSDYTVRSSYETASGNTTVEVKKSNNTVVVVVAVVIAVIFLVVFSR